MSKQKTASEMYPIVEEYESSQANRLDFCKSKNLTPSVLYYWRRKYLDEQVNVKSGEDIRLGFTEVIPDSERKLEISYPNGVRVRMSVSDHPLSTIQSLIRLY